MRCSRFLAPALGLALAGTGLAQTPDYKNVGRTPTAEEIKAWNISAGPDGAGLPPGGGNAEQGALIFASKCASCHGPNAEGGERGPRLVGGTQASLTTLHPVKSIPSYWPFATTVWDYINRAMPRYQGGSLTPDEVYALTAFILYRGGVVNQTDLLDAKTLPKVRMPNRNGFVPSGFNDLINDRKRGCRQGVCP
jgi:S-disulfanyl-L-cysteine oxidoreductase SoxD